MQKGKNPLREGHFLEASLQKKESVSKVYYPILRCHDPIIKTATIGGRCLVQEHCRGLKDSICLEDANITLPNGLAMKSCQCMPNYSNKRYSCELETQTVAGVMPFLTRSFSNIFKKFPSKLSQIVLSQFSINLKSL